MRRCHSRQEDGRGRTDVEVPRKLEADMQHCPADSGVGIDCSDDIRVLRQILGGAAVQTVDHRPGTLCSLPQRQGRWIGDDAQTADRDRVVSGCRPNALETIGDIGQQLRFSPGAQQAVGPVAQPHHQRVLAAER